MTRERATYVKHLKTQNKRYYLSLHQHPKDAKPKNPHYLNYLTTAKRNKTAKLKYRHAPLSLRQIGLEVDWNGKV